jgi:hypothetical protein
MITPSNASLGEEEKISVKAAEGVHMCHLLKTE